MADPVAAPAGAFVKIDFEMRDGDDLEVARAAIHSLAFAIEAPEASEQIVPGSYRVMLERVA